MSESRSASLSSYRRPRFSSFVRRLVKRRSTAAVAAASSVARPPAPFEALEGRTLLSVSLDSNGFTVVTPASDSRVVYVSSTSGSDSNAGTSPQAAVKSIARGKSLIRNGSADQLLFKRGDTFSGNFGIWGLSGRSADEPIVIGTYGTMSLFFEVQPYGRLLYGLIGATWAFHFTFTCWMIPKKQTDLTDHGTFFSLVVIYLMNLSLLSVMLVFASAQITFADLVERSKRAEATPGEAGVA